MSGKHGAGKGDRYRRVDPEKYAENWDKAFGNKDKEKDNERHKNCKNDKRRTTNRKGNRKD